MRTKIIRIASGGILYLASLIVKTDIELFELALMITCYLLVGGDVVYDAFKSILKGQVFDENFLMSIASIGAFFIGEYPEGVAVMLFYQVGEMFQHYAVDRSRKSISELMNIRPDYANVKKGTELVRTDPYDVKAGDIIVVKAGEKVPLDGIVIEGSSSLDTSALTGESVPREVEVGSEVLSGYINITGLITVKVTKEFEESTVSKILDMVENASSKKSNSERFITKFARYYTPVVVIIAALLAFVPPIFLGIETLGNWVYRALSFLVVSCPCALVISVPLSFFGGIGGASREGILVKGSNYLEALAKTEIIVFDKTGTLTEGVFNVKTVHAVNLSEDELIDFAAHAESYSNHPISQSLKRACQKEIDNSRVADVEEIPGYGVCARVDGKKVLAGNTKLMEKMGIPDFKDNVEGTVVHIAIDDSYAGYITIGDEIKKDSARAISELKNLNIKKTVMLTGDSGHTASKVASELGMDKVYWGLLPNQKVEKVEKLMLDKSSKGKLAFVGDGINDAPVLARADIGIAMGGLGSDAAIEAADIVVMTDEPSKVATAMKISRKTLKIAYQNIVFAISVKVLVLLLSAAGLSNMWEAVFADVGVSTLAIINSLRALSSKKY
ncbi:MAG TPA: heavy metal translocating P-type ATPase [Thermoclostridium sp.]